MADLDALTEADEARFNELRVEFDGLKDRVHQLRDQLRSAIDSGVRDGSLTTEPGTGQERTPELMRRQSKQDWWAPISPTSTTADELRSRALGIVERGDAHVERGCLDDSHPVGDEQRTRLEEFVRQDTNGALSEYVIATSRPAYRSAFDHMMRNEAHLMNDEERTALAEVNRVHRGRDEYRASLAEGNTGANAVPFYLDPTVILTNTGSKNPFRQICRIVNITTQTWHGVSSTGVTAEWTAESAQVADASPTLSQPSITPVRADAHVQLTMEMIADSNITEQLGTLFADAKDRLEAAAFATGTGSTQPRGIVTALGTVTASRVTSVTTAAYGAIDIFNVDSNLPARYRDSGAAWVGHWAQWNTVRQFSVGTGSLSGSFWLSLGGGVPPELVGWPVYSSSAMTNSTTTSGADVLVLGDWDNYVIVDRIGMSILVNPYVVGGGGRPIGETGYTAFWRVGGDTNGDNDAWRMLRTK
jgi:HK97 family phage major capsid protein